eukprot:jgi/Orpsp1_1/1184543/evm.model.c7180000089963.1
MLKTSRSHIKRKSNNSDNVESEEYSYLSLKTKNLIKKELKKFKNDEINDILYSLNDFIDIVNNFDNSDCSCRNELSFLLWKRSENKIIKNNYQYLCHENFIEKITHFFEEEYYYDIESETLQNIINIFIELITPSYYEENSINDYVTRWTFGIHELLSEYDPLPLYPEENEIIQTRIENLYKHSSNIFEKFISRLFFTFIIDESDKNSSITQNNELKECMLVAKFLLFSWKFGGKNIKSYLKKISYNDM